MLGFFTIGECTYLRKRHLLPHRNVSVNDHAAERLSIHQNASPPQQKVISDPYTLDIVIKTVKVH